MSTFKNKSLVVFVLLALIASACSYPGLPSVRATRTAAAEMFTAQMGAEPQTPPTAEPTPTTPPVPTPTAQPQTQPQAQPEEAVTQLVDHPLANTHWRLVAFAEPQGAPAPVVSGSEVTLELGADGNAGGNGGCNLYGGAYTLSGSSLSIGNVAHTERACADQDLNQQEQRYYEALQSLGDFSFSGERLVIAYGNGSGLLVFANAELPIQASLPGAGLCDTILNDDLSQWLCRSDEYGFEISYPLTGYLSEQTDSTARISLAYNPGTNLSEKYLEVGVVEGAETCVSPVASGYPAGELPSEDVVMNGVEFTKQTGQDSGAGNTYQWQAYTTTRDDLCLSMAFVLHSSRPDLFPEPPTEFDEGAESQVFEQIAASFQWLTASAVATVTAAPAALPSTAGAERIRFASGASSGNVNGQLAASASKVYVLKAARGQTMTISLNFERGDATLVVWGANGSLLMSANADSDRFEGVLPATQDYYIQVIGSPNGRTEYRMKVTIPPLSTLPTAAPTIRIRFKTGATSDSVSGHLAPSGTQLYVLRALKGQTMTVRLSFERGNATLAVWGANGAVLLSAGDGKSEFKGVLPANQDYYIKVFGRSNGETDYRLKVTIPPL